MKVRREAARCRYLRILHALGAKHLYLLDFSPDNLPNLKSTIEKSYPDVKVTTLEADAADETAIAGVCNRALKEEGRLDVFFANVCSHRTLLLMRSLYAIMFAGWRCHEAAIRNHHCRRIYELYESQRLVVRSICLGCAIY
jgi:hypothetical protein